MQICVYISDLEPSQISSKKYFFVDRVFEMIFQARFLIGQAPSTNQRVNSIYHFCFEIQDANLVTKKILGILIL